MSDNLSSRFFFKKSQLRSNTLFIKQFKNRIDQCENEVNDNIETSLDIFQDINIDDSNIDILDTNVDTHLDNTEQDVNNDELSFSENNSNRDETEFVNQFSDNSSDTASEEFNDIDENITPATLTSILTENDEFLKSFASSYNFEKDFDIGDEVTNVLKNIGSVQFEQQQLIEGEKITGKNKVLINYLIFIIIIINSFYYYY